MLFALDHHDQIVMIGKDHDYHGFRDLYQSQWKGIFVPKVAIYDGQIMTKSIFKRWLVSFEY